MPHRNAPLTETGRLRLARCIVDQGWPIARAAERFQISRPTATRWARRYAEFEAAGMVDRSSRPHRSPRQTPQSIVRKVVHLRWKQRLGPVAIADRVGLAPSTVHRILVSCRINRLWHIDRATGEPIRRYEAERPGELVHLDVKKLGNIPDGAGGSCSAATAALPTTRPISAASANDPAARPSATATSTPPSTAAPAWPTQRRSTTKPPPPRSRSSPAPAPTSPDTASTVSSES